MSLSNTQVANQNTYIAPFDLNLAAEGDYIYIDTSADSSPSSITLPNISACGFLGVSKRYIITDVSGNAASSPITILPSGGDEINFAASFVINENGASVLLQVVSGNRWMAVNNIAGGGGATTNIYNSNGTLDANRTLNGGAFNLIFNNIADYSLDALNLVTIGAPNVGITTSTSSILFQSNLIQTQINNGSLNLYALHANVVGGDNVNIKAVTTKIVLNAKVSLDIYKDDNFLYTMPVSAPSAGQVLVATDGFGALGWGTASGANIYNTNGQLTANRTLGGASQSYGLLLNDLLYFSSMASAYLEMGTIDAKMRIRMESPSVGDGVMRLSSSQPFIIEFEGTRVYTLPVDSGSNGQVLTTDGAGSATWQNSAANNGLILIQDYDDNKGAGLQSTWVYLDTLGYTTGVTGTAATTFPLVAQAYGVAFYDEIRNWTIDAVAIAEALLDMEGQNADSPSALYSKNNSYYYVDISSAVTTGILLPRSDQRSNTIQQFKIFWNNSKIKQGPNMLGNSAAVLYRVPSTQTEADDSYLDCKIHMQDLVIESNDPATPVGSGVGLLLAASNSAFLLNINIIGFEIGYYFQFLLGSEINKCLSTNCLTGFQVDRGFWTGASSGSTVSQLLFVSCRAYILDTGTGWYFSNADNSKMINCWGEGGSGDVANSIVYWKNTSQSTVKNFNVEGFRAEMLVAEAVFYIEGEDMGTVKIDSAFLQHAQTLISLNNIRGTTNVVNLKNININTVPWNLANQGGNGGGWIFENVYLQGDGAGNFPITPAQIVDTATFPNIWRTGTSPITSGTYTVPDASAPPYRVQIPIVRPL